MDERAEAEGSGLPGGRLRAARERLGLSLEATAGRLNLLVSQVRALEADRYDKLPGDTFVRGYLRSYARLVKLDGDELVYAYRTRRPRQPEPAMPRRSPPPSLDQSAGHRRYWGLAPVALLFVALWWWQDSRAPSEVVPLAADGGGSEYVPLPGGMDIALVDSVESSLLDSVQLMPTPVAGAVPAAGAGASAAGVPAVATVSPQPVQGAPAQPAGAEAPLPADQLSLRFTADCWVEIKDRDNKVLVAVLKRADDQLQVQGRGPFKVLLGFAPGVEMAYNGEPVNIDVSRGSRSARLIVGNS